MAENGKKAFADQHGYSIGESQESFNVSSDTNIDGLAEGVTNNLQQPSSTELRYQNATDTVNESLASSAKADATVSMIDMGIEHHSNKEELKNQQLDKQYIMRDKALKTMLTKGLTVDELINDLPEKYNDMVIGSQQHPNDAFVIQIAKNNAEQFPKDPKKANAQTKQYAAAIGLDIQELTQRASMGGRFQNGVALTIAQAYDGVNQFMKLLGLNNEQAISSSMVDILTNLSEQDSRLYGAMTYGGSSPLNSDAYNEKSINPLTPAIDIATTVGKAAPLVAGGIAGGTTRTGIAVADILPGVATVAGDKDSTKADYALALLGPAVGGVVSKLLGAKTQEAFANVSSLKQALKDEPRLEHVLKQSGVDVPKLMDDMQYSNKIDYGTKDGVKLEVGPLEPTDDLHIAAFKNASTEQKAEITKNLPSELAKSADSPDEFFASIVKHGPYIKETGNVPLYNWGKTMDELAKNSKVEYNSVITKLGVNGMLLSATGVPGLRLALPTVVNNYLSNVYTKVKTEGISALAKPRVGPIKAVTSSIND